jgi:AcrB/AcrD/AcrF family
MVGLLLLGLVAYPLLPVASLPNVNYPTISVTSQLPGADQQTMAATVTSPLELQFGEIPGVALMTSSSTLGESVINVQFNPVLADRAHLLSLDTPPRLRTFRLSAGRLQRLASSMAISALRHSMPSASRL